jgi:hypothetical protein
LREPPIAVLWIRMPTGAFAMTLPVTTVWLLSFGTFA